MGTFLVKTFIFLTIIFAILFVCYRFIDDMTTHHINSVSSSMPIFMLLVSAAICVYRFPLGTAIILLFMASMYFFISFFTAAAIIPAILSLILGFMALALSREHGKNYVIKGVSRLTFFKKTFIFITIMFGVFFLCYKMVDNMMHNINTVNGSMAIIMALGSAAICVYRFPLGTAIILLFMAFLCFVSIYLAIFPGIPLLLLGLLTLTLPREQDQSTR